MGVYWGYTYLVNGSTLEICRVNLVGFVANSWLVGGFCWWLGTWSLGIQGFNHSPTNSPTSMGVDCVCSLPAVDPWGRRFPTFLGGWESLLEFGWFCLTSLLHRGSDLEAGMMYSKNLFNPKNLVEIGWIRRLEFGKALDDWNCLCFFLVRFIQWFWLLFIYSVLSVGLENNTGWCFFQLFFMFTPNLG